MTRENARLVQNENLVTNFGKELIKWEALLKFFDKRELQVI